MDDSYRSRISIAKIQASMPELLNRRAGPGDVPIDLSIRVGASERSGEWSYVFAGFGGIIPVWMSSEERAKVEMSVGDGASPLPVIECVFVLDNKMSVFSPLALIPYSDKDGFQENDIKKGFSPPDMGGVFSRTVAKGMAIQLKKYAIERLSVPDIDFSVNEDGK